MSKIKLARSHHFLNKDNHAPERNGSNKYAYIAFATADATPEQIAAHIRSGKAICVAALKDDYRKKENFISAQLMGVDFDSGGRDVDDLLLDDLINDYAFMVYRTASYTPEAPRCRALFILDEPITDQERYRVLLRRLLQHFASAGIDEACKDGVRIFYGSTVEGDTTVSDARLPLAVLEALPKHPAELPRPTPPAAPVSTSRTQGDWSAYVQQAIDAETADVRSTTSGRNNQLNRSAFALGQLVGSTWARLSRTDAENALMSAAPIAHDFPTAEAQAAVKSGLDAGIAQPRPEPQQNERYTRPSYTRAGQPQEPPPFVLEDFVTHSDDATKRYLAALKGEYRPDVTPIAIPFRVLHEFGGFAKVISPGKLIGVIGATGGGKTSFLDAWVDALRRDGVSVLRYSPEWTPDEGMHRLGQRYGGATLEEMYLYQVGLSEDERGVPEAKRHGVPLTDEQKKASAQAALNAYQWTGKLYDIHRVRMTLDELLTAIEQTVTTVRAGGKSLSVLVVDYAQIIRVNARDGRGRTLNDAIGELKALCIDCKLVGVIASQVTKADTRAASSGERKLLDESSAQFLRFDEFNLALSLNLNYDPETNEPTGTGTIAVLKNNAGRRGQVEVYANLAKLTWTDKKTEYVTTHFDDLTGGAA